MSYSTKESLVIKYIANYFNTNDFKILAPLVRNEFGNHRSEQAYISRMYNVLKNITNDNQNQNQIELFNILDIKSKFLYKLLQPEPKFEVEITDIISINNEEKEEIDYNFYQVEYQTYQLELRHQFRKLRKIIDDTNKDIVKLKKSLDKEHQKYNDLKEKLNKEKVSLSIQTEEIIVRKNEKEVDCDGDIFMEERDPDMIARKIVDNIVDNVFQESTEIEETQISPLDAELFKYLDQLETEIVPRTIEEWKQNQIQTRPLHNFVVKSETQEGLKYNVNYSGEKNSYYCECHYWNYQKVEPELRTCKHILAIRGEEAERTRIQNNNRVFGTKKQKK
jgi:hypothetical protein